MLVTLMIAFWHLGIEFQWWLPSSSCSNWDTNIGSLTEELNKFENKIQGSAENLPFRDNSFDNVFCSFVWRNLSDTNKALDEIYRVLRPGGKFVLLDMTRPKNSFLKILHKIGISKTDLLTNSRQKPRIGLSGYGLSIESYSKY